MAGTAITVAYGDGIGPEITAAVLEVLRAAGAAIEAEAVEIGEQVYRRGNPAGIDPAAWESLRRTKVFLKAPITTPPGAGYKSFNVTTRKTLALYANVRPCVSYYPFIDSKHPQMDVVIIRENEEDLYTGIEYRVTPNVVEALKLISRPGCERIARYAFEYARRHNRRKVACFTKDNVLIMTDGLFHQVFEETAAEYPDIQHEHWYVDLGAAQLAGAPEAFDVVVLPNQYGDILAEVGAQVAGSLGLAASANIGELCAMFEAAHGSAPRRAGQNLANPSGLLLAAVLMLVHIGQPEAAGRVHNAWLRTIEDGVHTYDIFSDGQSTEKVGTREFAAAVIARLGQKPHRLQPAGYSLAAAEPARPPHPEGPRPTSELAGIDIYVEWPSRNPNELGPFLKRLDADGLELEMLTNRGVKVWPEGMAETFCTDSFRCRFLAKQGTRVTHAKLIALLGRLAEAGVEVSKTEYLRNFDGRPGFTLAQGL